MESIDYSPLFAQIQKSLGIYLPNLSMDFSNPNRPKIVSGNLVEHAGLFKGCLSEVEVSVFSSGNSDICLWLNVNVFYEHISGRSNGLTLFDAYYKYETKEWSFVIGK